MIGAPFAAALGAITDVFGAPLRGLLLLCVAMAAALLAGLVWAALTYLVPLVPWQGWLGVGVETLAGAVVVVAAFVLLPLVTMIVGGVFLDFAAERVERARFATATPGRGLAPQEGLKAGLRIAALALPLNQLALPLLFVPVVNIFVYWGLNGFLLGREYFSLATLRLRPWSEVQALRKRHFWLVFLAGLALAAVMAVPILNFLAPLFGIALMVRLSRTLLNETGAPAPVAGG